MDYLIFREYSNVVIADGAVFLKFRFLRLFFTTITVYMNDQPFVKMRRVSFLWIRKITIVFQTLPDPIMITHKQRTYTLLVNNDIFTMDAGLLDVDFVCYKNDAELGRIFHTNNSTRACIQQVFDCHGSGTDALYGLLLLIAGPFAAVRRNSRWTV